MLGASCHERTLERNGRANGFKERNLPTRLEQIGVSVPALIVPHDVRFKCAGAVVRHDHAGGEGAFRPASLEAALLSAIVAPSDISEKALKVALAEMYIQGVATRRVKEIMEALCGFEISSAEVSRAGMDGSHSTVAQAS